MARDPVETLGDHIHAAVSAGADWVQVREKDLTARALFGLVRRSVEITNERDTGARVVVNDRIDVALAAGAQVYTWATIPFRRKKWSAGAGAETRRPIFLSVCPAIAWKKFAKRSKTGRAMFSSVRSSKRLRKYLLDGRRE